MTEYVVSLWAFTGDSSLDQATFGEESLIKLAPNVASPPGWAYGICEIGGVKGYFPLNYTEPYDPQKHTNIPPPVVTVVEEPPPQQQEPFIEQPGDNYIPDTQQQPYDATPVETTYDYEQPQQGYDTGQQIAPELPPLTNVPIPSPQPTTPSPSNGRPLFVRTPVPPGGGRGSNPSSPAPSSPAPSTPTVFSPPKPQPVHVQPVGATSKPPPPSVKLSPLNVNPKPAPTSFSPSPSPSTFPKPTPSPASAPSSPYSPKPSPVLSSSGSHPVSARAAAPLPTSGGTRPKPRPVSTFIMNTPPPAQPMIRGRPAPGFSSPSNGQASPQHFQPAATGGSPDLGPISNGGSGGGGGGAMDEMVTYCEALYDYTGDPAKNIFSFPQGSLIELKVKYDSGWWSGMIDGQLGYFPSNFVKELPPRPRNGQARFAATTENLATSPRRAADDNRRRSLGAPIPRTALKGNGLSLSHSDLHGAAGSGDHHNNNNKRMTLASPITSVPGVGRGGMPPMMGMGNPNFEEEGKKKKGLFSALKLKKKQDKAQTHVN